MYKLEFTLKQHTPLIHFQHDQAGATLRASEVKPKLDRFILQDLLNINENLYNEYIDLICNYLKPAYENKKTSLYKIHLTSEIDKKVLLFSLTSEVDANLIKKHKNAAMIAGENFEVAWETPLFSNNSLIKFAGNNARGDRRIRDDSKWEELKLGVWLKNIRLTIISYDFQLIKLISECLPFLFAKENFGLRQSKGFGCFSIENQTKLHIEALSKLAETYLYRKVDTGDWKNKFKSIREFWKLLKAGDSHGTYYKADIMKFYCMLDGTRWEKRKIKKSLHVKHRNIYNSLRVTNPPNRIAGCISDPINPEQINSSENFMYVRALLGLAEHFEFGLTGSDPLKVKISNSEIARFRSPITIKVYDDEIYLICYPLESDLSSNGNNMFSFDIEENNGNLASLPIPANFNLRYFLDSPWLGNNFEKVKNWETYTDSGKTKHETVALHHKFTKV
jgi:hypothetical protein